MASPNYSPLWFWITEREQIRIKKSAGCARPWTTDPILQTYRFCNARREDDLGTIWIRQNIREPFADHPDLWFMLCIARQINWPPTLAELIFEDAWPTNSNFDLSHIAAVLRNRKDRGDKVFTGAYMISAPSTKGMDKAEYIVNCVCGDLWRRGITDFNSLESVHRQIHRHHGWGQFMAYQAVVDMRFTALLSNATDIATWAAAGPGTLRGLNRIHGRLANAPIPHAQSLAEMQAIYAIAQAETGVEMDFSDIPNALCEVDKYLRVKLGEGKPRALYVEGRGA